MRTITNDYRDAQILNLGSVGERGPYLVTQTGVAPRDSLPKTRMFVLRPDGSDSLDVVRLRAIMTRGGLYRDIRYEPVTGSTNADVASVRRDRRRGSRPCVATSTCARQSRTRSVG